MRDIHPEVYAELEKRVVAKWEERRRNCQHPEESRWFDWETAAFCWYGTPCYYCGECGSEIPDDSTFLSNLVGAVVTALVGFLLLSLLAWMGVLRPLAAVTFLLLAALVTLGLIMTVVGWIRAAVRLFRPVE